MLDLFNKYYRILSVVSVPKRIDREQIPYGAFKEAILNVIIDRDYLVNRGIQISMYDYVIEIILPVVGYEYHKLNEEEGIITYLKAHPNASRSKIESKLQIERARLLRRLNELIESKIVKKTGNGPNMTYYI